MKNFMNKFRNLSLTAQILLSVAAFFFYGFSSFILEESYSASKFPVPYYIGQTSFDAAKIKMWYASMIKEGTLGVYFDTQLIDFLFILSVVVGGFFIWTTFARLHRDGSFFRNYGYRFAFMLPLAGLFDVLENLVSFVMLADPTGFSEFTAIVYSSFAVVKFAFWVVGLIWLLLSVIVLIFTKVHGMALILSPKNIGSGAWKGSFKK